MRSLCLAVLVLGACPGRSGTPPREPGPGSGSAPPAGSGSQVVQPPAGPTDEECTQLIDHAMALGVTRHRATAPSPDKIATVEETAAIRAEVDAELRPACRALARDAYRCGITATTLDQFIACDASRSGSSGEAE